MAERHPRHRRPARSGRRRSSPHGTGRTACTSSACARRSASSASSTRAGPNVTADAGALCLKAGNAVILRGGSDSINSSAAIHACLVEGLKQAGLPEARHPDRADHRPRRRRRDAERPRRHYRRHRAARRQEPRRARAGGGPRAGLRPSRGHLPRLCRRLRRSRDGQDDRRQLQDAPHRHLRRGRDAARRPRRRRTRISCRSSRRWPRPAARSAADAAVVDRVPGASRRPRRTGRPNISTRSSRSTLVDGVGGAIDHIESYSSHHTEAIVAEDPAAVERFFNEIDSRHPAAQRLDPVRRRRRVRHGRGDRHRHRQDARARPGRRRAADLASNTASAATGQMRP